MSLTSLNFKYKRIAKKREFEFILAQISECYKLMLSNYDTIENDENKIRNRLVTDYLDNQEIIEKFNLEPYFFDIETPFVNEHYEETARSDIKIYTATERLKNRQSPYFIIECKRLGGTNIGKGSLNYKYVGNGISRFISRDDYPSHYGINGMIGFIVKPTNINNVVSSINQLLPDNEDLNSKKISESFEFSYLSNHSDNKGNKIELYHLMFDFSSLIENN